MEPNQRSAKRELVAYVHNVSPVKTSGGKKKSYFDMQLQTENDVVRGVCFASTRHADFSTVAEKKSPVKLLNIDFDKHDHTSVLMGGTVQLHEVKASFAATTIPTSVNVSSLAAVNDKQIVSFKAKVATLSGTKRVDTRNGVKRKAEALLVDPHGGVKLVLWEDFILQVKEGLTYTFTNVRVRKNNTNASVSVSTPNSSDCTIEECKPFTEPLATPAELPETFTSNGKS
ncbi:Hypothetical predicted protein [Paramuricea clavata]|uniref:Uncharacterized protein n=1 Tax=Paramuricea clavata TaxID=317549 RepID=A0A7D9DIT5_PARCT|nr:Hypothetical predicted protein [Paramuricea clavata]